MLFYLLTFTSTVLSAIVCVYSVYKRSMQKSAFFNLLTIAIAIYLLGNCIEVSSQTFESSNIGLKVAYIGIPFISPLWYLCIREVCGKRSGATLIALIMVIPFAVFCMALTWETNHLLFANVEFTSDNHYGQMIYTNGPLYWSKQAYLYSLNILGVLTILFYYIKGTKRFRRQALYFFISALIPAFTIGTYLAKIGDVWVDVTPYGLSMAVTFFLLAHSKYGLKNYSSVIQTKVVNELLEGVIIFDQDGIHMYSNSFAKDIFPELKELKIGTSLSEMAFLPFDIATMKMGENALLEFNMKHEDIIRTYSLSLTCVRQDDKVLGYFATIHNITPIKTLMNKLEIKAYVDPLTGIYNRGFFFEKANHAQMEAKLARNPLCLIMFDLDHFKKVNDTYGHACGDHVLRTVADITKNCLRKADVFGRYGGEEFVILLPLTALAESVAKAEQIREVISGHGFQYEGNTIGVTVSLGVASLDTDTGEDSVDALLKRADACLYAAKQNGRNQVVADKRKAAHTDYHRIMNSTKTRIISIVNKQSDRKIADIDSSITSISS